MKKLFLSLLVMLLMASTSNAAGVQELINGKKPLVLLVYASWADGLDGISKAFSDIQKTHADRYNFKALNIASEETKSFNKSNYIYPNLPYIMLYKSQGKITRVVGKDCVIDPACFKNKLDIFAE